MNSAPPSTAFVRVANVLFCTGIVLGFLIAGLLAWMFASRADGAFLILVCGLGFGLPVAAGVAARYIILGR